MSIPAAVWEHVRQRARFACEYCGVSETDTGGRLTVDHFQPKACGGSDDPDNLLYCCHGCNLYKADYRPRGPKDPALWNPRQEPAEAHLLTLADGTLYPITAMGAFAIERLRLNRALLVSWRRRKQLQSEALRLLDRYREVVGLLEQLYHRQAALLEEHRALLEEQRAALRLLLKGDE